MRTHSPAVRCCDWPELTVQSLSVPQRKELIEKFLARFSRRLSRDHVDQIAGAGSTANPLFLSAMLDELRQFGQHERLGEMTAHYLIWLPSIRRICINAYSSAGKSSRELVCWILAYDKRIRQTVA